MPRQTKKYTESAPRSPIGQRKNGKKDEWGGFAQVNLDESDREQFDLWMSEHPESVWPLLIDSLAQGLKLTMVWDGANECFIATFTGRPDPEGKLEFTTSLSARNVDFMASVSLLIYKHVELCGEDWSEWLINGSKAKRNFG